jgi:ATP:ADP antiporter, AAA family
MHAALAASLLVPGASLYIYPLPAAMTAWLARILKTEQHELPALLWAFFYFFCLLCSYYILRPVRDDMGIQGGVDKLQWLFSATFVAMLVAVPFFGFLSSRFPRQRLIPFVYCFFAANLLLFFFLMRNGVDKVILARSFFVWVSVFNLFVISIFWSFMADIFSNDQAKRLFGVVAAGGSAGAICGPLLTTFLVGQIGTGNLLLLSIGFLLISLLAVAKLNAWTQSHGSAKNHSLAIGGSIWAGIRLTLKSPYLIGSSVYLLCLTLLATLIYFEQMRLVADHLQDSAARTRLFAQIDLVVNTMTLLVEIFLTNRLIGRFGVALLLMVLPLLNVLGFSALVVAPTLVVLVAFQALRRVAEYALARPAREILFTVVSREEKYKAKNFIDTVIYRGGDAASGWLSSALKGMGVSLTMVATMAIPLAVAAAAVGWLLGKQQEKLKSQQQAATK